MKAIVLAKDVYEAARLTYNDIMVKRQELARGWVDAKRWNYEHSWASGLLQRISPRSDLYWQSLYEQYLDHPRVYDLYKNQKRACLILLAMAEAAMHADQSLRGATLEIDDVQMSNIEYGFAKIRAKRQEPDQGGTKTFRDPHDEPLVEEQPKGRPLFKV